VARKIVDEIEFDIRYVWGGEVVFGLEHKLQSSLLPMPFFIWIVKNTDRNRKSVAYKTDSKL